MWQRMIERIDDYKAGNVELGALLDDLRGLFVEADPHDQKIRSDFQDHWLPIDMEYELRMEGWAPAGSADDRTLAAAVDRFRDWVDGTVLADPTSDHN